uniref:C2H2-type domain-containing protein n=1 Tax=Bracon brevicornis TaxID=1563983 RepID=A0A6V7KYA2_9HYME
MDSMKRLLKCIICDVQMTGLQDLHEHQLHFHSVEELSFGIVSLQSFIYHQHYFQKLDESPVKDVCVFYPFCSQLWNVREGKCQNEEENKATVNSGQNAVKLTPFPEVEMKPQPLRRPLGERNILVKPEDSFNNAALELSDSSLILKMRQRIKHKRLMEKNGKPRMIRSNKQMINKPARKPMLKKENASPVQKSKTNIGIHISDSSDEMDISDSTEIPSKIDVIQDPQLTGPKPLLMIKWY